MLPPVLEIYVVWHPDDADGIAIAERFVEHFHGTTYTGLIGGAVEVFVRSAGWSGPGDAPRPIPVPGNPPPSGIEQAQFVAVVPVLGNEFADAVQEGSGPWYDYATGLLAALDAAPDRVGVFPLLVDRGAVDGTELGGLFGKLQQIATPGGPPGESTDELRCRDLAQAITQLASPAHERVTIFISHTKRVGDAEQGATELIDQVRGVIAKTRLREFFDASDLQAGQDWDQALRDNAGTAALLAIRTDLYASRDWCQREMLIAKRAGMPVVIMDALGRGEERGSFLMDHVPRVPLRPSAAGWDEVDIRRGLNLVVDECLKRALWRHQRRLAGSRDDLQVGWWAPHAPEPVTLSEWLTTQHRAGSLSDARPIRILHPDPPLGQDEMLVLNEIAALVGVSAGLDVMTPRLLAARGG